MVQTQSLLGSHNIVRLMMDSKEKGSTLMQQNNKYIFYSSHSSSSSKLAAYFARNATWEIWL